MTHAGQNDLPVAEPNEIISEMRETEEQVAELEPSIKISVSGFITRRDTTIESSIHRS